MNVWSEATTFAGAGATGRDRRFRAKTKRPKLFRVTGRSFKQPLPRGLLMISLTARVVGVNGSGGGCEWPG